MTESHFGLMVGPMPTERGTLVYAELEPAASLFRWISFGQYRAGWRNYWPFHGGRSWRQLHIRWWFEIQETATNDPEDEFGDIGTHWHTHDGGGITLRHAMRNATKAVGAVVKVANQEHGVSMETSR